MGLLYLNKNDMDEHVARMGDSWGAYRVLVGGAEGGKPFGRTRLTGMITLKWIL